MTDNEKKLFVMWISILIVAITLDMRISKLERLAYKKPTEVNTDGD